MRSSAKFVDVVATVCLVVGFLGMFTSIILLYLNPVTDVDVSGYVTSKEYIPKECRNSVTMIGRGAMPVRSCTQEQWVLYIDGERFPTDRETYKSLDIDSYVEGDYSRDSKYKTK